MDATGRNGPWTLGPGCTVSLATKKFGAGSLYFSPTRTTGSGAAPTVKGAASTTSMTFGTAPFTIEAWVNPSLTGNVGNDAQNTTPTQIGQIVGLANSTNERPDIVFWVSPTYIGLKMGSGNLQATLLDCWAAGTITPGQWSHVAVCRSGATIQFFVNGTPTAATTFNLNPHNGNYGTLPVFTAATAAPIGANPYIEIGGNSSVSNYNTNFGGYIDELRITKGVSRYAGAFAVPTAAFPDPS